MPHPVAPSTLRLRTGQEEAKGVVIATFSSLRALSENHPAAFLQAAALARDPGHEPAVAVVLWRFGLIDHDGRMPDPVRNVILASIKGEGDRVRLVNPVARPEAR